jgi:hypothetical protein
MDMSGHIPRRTLTRLPCFEVQRALSHCSTVVFQARPAPWPEKNADFVAMRQFNLIFRSATRLLASA